MKSKETNEGFDSAKDFGGKVGNTLKSVATHANVDLNKSIAIKR